MKLRPEEITAVLKSQIMDYEAEVDVQEVGTVLQVGDGIARIHGLENAVAAEMLELPHGVMGLVLNLEEDSVGAVLLGEDYPHQGRRPRQAHGQGHLGAGGRGAHRPRGEPAGEPLDEKGPIEAAAYRPVEFKAPGVIRRQPVKEPLQTGLKAIDSMIPIGRGQRELIIGDRGTGKTAIAVDTIINQKGQDVICIYVAIGQKASTVAQLVSRLEQFGAMDYTIVVMASASGLGSASLHRALRRGGHGRVLHVPRASTPSASTTTSPSMRTRTGRCRCCCAARRAARPSPATSSTCTAACWSGPASCATRRAEVR